MYSKTVNDRGIQKDNYDRESLNSLDTNYQTYIGTWYNIMIASIDMHPLTKQRQFYLHSWAKEVHFAGKLPLHHRNNWK